MGLTENPLKKLLKYLAPEYVLPSRGTISSRITIKYNFVKSNIKSFLNSVDYVCLTTDLWTSRNTKSYITVTAHTVTCDWKYVNVTLTTEEMAERHTAINLKEKLLAILDDWQLNDKIFAVVHDNALNITNAVKENFNLFGESIPCFAHTLQLCINKSFEDENIKKLITKCCSIVSHFHHSTVAINALNDKQEQLNIKKQKLKQYVRTRWNSVYYMFERLIEQRSAIAAVLSDRSVTNIKTATALSTCEFDWQLCEELVKLLKPFEVATTLLSSSSTVTYSMVKPVLKSILDNFLNASVDDSVFVQTVKTCIKNEITRRFKIDDNNLTLDLSVYLDPRYKNTLNLERRFEVQNYLKNKLDNTSILQDTESTQLKTVTNTALDFLFPEDTSLEPKSEIDTYSNDNQINKHSCPFEWWKQNSAKYPNLKKIARKYLAITATSVPSERVFSSAGNLVTAKRNCLSGKNVNMLIFLFCNSKLNLPM